MKTLSALSLAASVVALGVTSTSAVSNAAVLSNSHVAWCEQNYRSYNPATDSYTGYDGYTHRCVSPGNTVTFGAVNPYVFVPNNSARGVDQFNNPNGQGSGTQYRVFPGDDENGTPENPPND